MAKHILSLTSSSSGCKCNFRSFEIAITVRYMDDTCEWLVDAEDDPLFYREDLTWSQACKATGSKLSPMRYIRSKPRGKRLKKVTAEDEEKAHSQETREEEEYVKEGDNTEDDNKTSRSPPFLRDLSDK
ncbi:hypothetical protein AMTR_s00119p00034500 [Amborella trichopoda]|uniref:Uncharacterized protein n=1 Tax=Amborella trichopoda TaxID=13333 RepID=W1NND4_AMBTC|nr:hypothetical protein AMTR_s00119p00034500 [Amborella trichopoda]